MNNLYAAQKQAKKLDVTSRLSDEVSISITGEQKVEGVSRDGKIEYELSDRYDLTLDLSDVEGKFLNDITVKLPGLDVELGIGWIYAKTDYGWKTYLEYDSPHTWKKNVLGDD